MDKEKIVEDIIVNINDMLKNNIEIYSNDMFENFCDWCNGGEIIDNYENYTTQEKKEAFELMKIISRDVDKISYKLYKFLRNDNYGI